MCEGKSFHIHAPVTGKVRRPTVESLTTGTNRLLVEDLVLAGVLPWQHERAEVHQRLNAENLNFSTPTFIRRLQSG